VNHDAPNHDQLQLDDGASDGSWTAVHDSGRTGTSWGRVSWHARQEPGTLVIVEVRAADSAADLFAKPFRTIENDVSFCGCDGPISGRFLEVRVKLRREAGCVDTPVLEDLSVKCCQ
jgi:hypothetical protein